MENNLIREQKKGLKIIYILCCICFFISIVLLVLGIQSLPGFDFSKILYNDSPLFYSIASILYIFIVLLRNRTRKIFIAISFLVYAIVLLLSQIDYAIILVKYHLSLNNNLILDIVNQILVFASGITLFVLTYQLLRNAINKPFNTHLSKVMGIIFIVSCIINHAFLSGEGDFLLTNSISYLLVTLFYYGLLIVILYISLIKKSFYKNFIEAHPKQLLKSHS